MYISLPCTVHYALFCNVMHPQRHCAWKYILRAKRATLSDANFEKLMLDVHEGEPLIHHHIQTMEKEQEDRP